jgi:hypothetical protein
MGARSAASRTANALASVCRASEVVTHASPVLLMQDGQRLMAPYAYEHLTDARTSAASLLTAVPSPLGPAVAAVAGVK